MSRRDATACFERCYSKLMVFVFKEDDATRVSLNLLLDELIALDCNSLGASNEAGNNVLKKLSTLIPQMHERLVTKVCYVIHNFIKYKLVQRLGMETSRALTDFTVQALRMGPEWSIAEVLRAVAILMEDHCEPFLRHEDFLVGKTGLLVHIITSPEPDVATLAEATHCLRSLAIRTTDKEGLCHANAVTCFTTLLTLLHKIPSLQLYNSMQCRLVGEALQGIHSLVVNAKVEVEPYLGQFLAAIKGYMFHGLGEPMTIPPELFPTIASGYNTKSPPGATPNPAPSPRTDSSTPTSSAKTRNKKTRKKKGGGASEDAANDDHAGDGAEKYPVGGRSAVSGFEPMAQASWTRWTSSDSEFSDSEAGQGGGGKSHLHSTKVRVAAFTCLAGMCKLVDKRAMFGYWPFFIPDSAASGNSPQVQSLFTSILKDPSPKCRMGALVSLTAMLDGTKQFMAAAEESYHQRTSFTPLSTVLGSMIREMHRALLQALVVENYNLTLTQLIKCLATLVVNVPYHRLQPGLLSRVVKQIRHFLSHKDSNVRVACLTCLGAMVSHQPPLMEVLHIVQSPTPPVGMTTSSTLGITSLTSTTLNDSGIDSHSASSTSSVNATEISGAVPMAMMPSVSSSDAGTPVLGASSPGIQTPVFSDQMLQAQAQGTSWLIKLCLKNILPQPVHGNHSNGVGGVAGSNGGGGGGGGKGEETGGTTVEPLPVRLESLQVLATLCKGYFPVIRSQLPLMQGLILACLEDPDSTIKLHGCKVLEELGSVMMDMQEKHGPPVPSTLPLTMLQLMWQAVLDGPLLDILSGPTTTNPVRASACDCIATVGPDIFTCLSKEQQQQCLRLVLQLTQCSDRLVVSAAVRALGIFALYPCLSPDVTFVADAANAMLKCLSVPSINVKIKAAWSLGNLCDALVVNKDNQDVGFMDQFSDMLLSTMLTAASNATQESDKVKCNAVRAVGNILRYLPARSLGKSHMVEAVSNSVKVIIKTMNSGPMKVRWNSCYAMANMMRNPLLFTSQPAWLDSVLTALAQVVKDCKNFKVRINAALALSVPGHRCHYGQVALYVMVWRSLVEALKTADDITDFAEFRYKESLTEQVCLAALHMLSLSEVEDVCGLLPALQTQGLVFQEHMAHFLATRTPVRASALKCVRQRLSVLASCQLLTEDLATGLQLLREICLLDSEEAEAQVTPPRLTAFRQIYD
ncbi:HEAT repeat-containing protein 6-like isoform X2 [Babylonia areolata]|uniref:HEAT repeat-containing protein 6-like isoform X2 n=1 Tax=Babylonia areolata TaxID=304850 RepID=UPI003FD43345